MLYKLFDLFVEFQPEGDVQMRVQYPYGAQHVIEATFRGEPHLVRSWLGEIPDRTSPIFIEIKPLYRTDFVLVYGEALNGEIYRVERNSLDLELEHLAYTPSSMEDMSAINLGELLREKFG